MIAPQAHTLDRRRHQLKTAVVSLFVIMLSWGLLVGCAGPRDVQPRYHPSTRTDHAPTTEVDVLHTVPLARPYRELGEIVLRVTKQNTHDAVYLLTEEAKRIGADAIILMGKRRRGARVVSVGPVRLVLSKDIYAIAIQYAD